MVTPVFSLKLNGKKIEDLTRKSVLQVRCDLQLTMASEISLVIHDPNYKITDSGLFELGGELETEIGFGSTFHRIMSGEIISLEPEISESNGAKLVVRAYDKSYRLRRNKPVRPPFLEMRDSDIASQIAQEAGLQAEVEQTPIIHEYLQQTGSDWRFLKNRAQANGYELFIQLDTLVFRRPKEISPNPHSLKRSRDLFHLYLRLSAIDQPNLHVVRGWDMKQKQPLVAKSLPVNSELIIAGDELGAKITSDAFGESRSVTFDRSIASQDEAEHLAQAEFNNRARNFIEGEGMCLGKPEMKAGDRVELLNMGTNFSGLYYLTKVTHVINSNGYRTHFAMERNAL